MTSSTSKIRPTAVAGSFYPGESNELRATLEGLLRDAKEQLEAAGAAGAVGAAGPQGRAPKAVIAPHAGYVYSGPIAASAFLALAAGPALERIVLLGPSHFVPFEGLALPGSMSFATPLGELEIDGEGSRDALRLPQVRVMPAAHAREHSLEVELPFVRHLFPTARIVALVVGRAAPDEVAEVLEALWGGPESAIVVSSDLSHYLPYEAARRLDRATADEILALGGPLDGSQACGAAPINGLLVAARRRGLRAQLLDLRNSADTVGDPSRVVGYGAFAFHEPE